MSYLAIHILVTLMCFLHLLPKLFVDFVSDQSHSHCHQSSSQRSRGRINHRVMMTFMVVTPFWRVKVWTRINAWRRGSRISTWSPRIRMMWQRIVRHWSWTDTISHGWWFHTRWVLHRIGGVCWVHRWRWSRVGCIGRCKAVPRGVGRVYWVHWWWWRRTWSKKRYKWNLQDLEHCTILYYTILYSMQKCILHICVYMCNLLPWFGHMSFFKQESRTQNMKKCANIL